MDDLEQQLIGLITQIRQHVPKSLQWRLAMNRLLLEIQQFPGLRKSSHPDYPEALNRTFEWVSNNISEFEPYSDSVAESLVRWVNGYLRWRIQDLYSPDKNAPLSLDVNIASDFGEITLLDKLPNSTLSGLDALIENSQRESKQRIGLELKLYIEQDPEEKLKNSYLRSSVECNCQFLSQRLVLKEPPDKVAEIARDLSIPRTTVNSHWKRKCEPMLQKIAENLGYKQEQSL
ncbi:hypothetical protein NIES37_71240 (plasmid) [Tolypothrix tenuis PCC 7101]|uniref:Sigma-70 family RNA polymerase sigma factor n=1 Tax=Tolypothrix tenuis PCC 7101 TaxID=231146 RepID=A0A1Z4NBK8_9CYAN|nr:hypothetical protein [Aulosira sp. FACHB-113]BAZ03111.1 hypothetical protein NIES37_71240 [Tolypothrix tenuis PCC 7101]BAZ78617.1 hypothetical protein NIES50_72500 [Aulosira laxa NIES-50]